MVQHEIVERSNLLSPDGSLTQRGWARHPILDCNLEDAHVYRFARPLQWFRIKRWDYYGVTFPTGYFSATLADLGYAGQAFIYMVDFETETYKEDTITIPFGTGIQLPRNSHEGVSSWSGRTASLRFETDNTKRIATVEWSGFAGEDLTANLTFDANGESTVIATPIGERRFYYNRKINCMPVAGDVAIGNRSIPIEPATSSGTLDWGRGAWRYRSFWVWASASGFLDSGRRIGLNMGFGFGDTSAATENTLIIDGRIHKLEDVTFKYDNSDFMKPWHMGSTRADVTFTPMLDRFAKTNLLVVRSKVHQLFGHYSGSVIDDLGTEIHFEDVPGWAEEHHARW